MGHSHLCWALHTEEDTIHTNFNHYATGPVRSAGTPIAGIYEWQWHTRTGSVPVVSNMLRWNDRIYLETSSSNHFPQCVCIKLTGLDITAIFIQSPWLFWISRIHAELLLFTRPGASSHFLPPRSVLHMTPPTAVRKSGGTSHLEGGLLPHWETAPSVCLGWKGPCKLDKGRDTGGGGR